METVVVAERPIVELSLEGPRPQRRWTIALRLILAIPHFVWMWLVGMAAGLAVMVGWVAAVFTGRLPAGIREFVGHAFEYQTRVYGYLFLLTDQYPPFGLEPDDEYAVEVLLPPATRLNRAAVLFRIVLMVPAWFVLLFVQSGLYAVEVVLWLIALIRGCLPTPAFEANAVIVRYYARFYAFAFMLTPEFPRGLFGDRPLAPAPLPADLHDVETPAPPGARPRITRIVLSKGGKRLTVLVVVLGAIFAIGGFVVGAVAGSQSSESAQQLDRHYRGVVAASQDFGTAIQRCGISADGPTCVHAADRELAAAVRTFRRNLQDVRWPGAALGSADQLDRDAARLASVLDDMASTSDATRYQALAVDFQTVANALDRDYRDLRSQLVFGN